LVVIAAGVGVLFHVWAFVLESFLFTKPIARRLFGTTVESAETMRFMAFNQGFYNLFLALGTLAGIGLWLSAHPFARPLLYFGCGCMVGAGLVLATGGRRYMRAVVLQGLPPAVAIVALALT
jgi:putative membrane protein